MLCENIMSYWNPAQTKRQQIDCVLLYERKKHFWSLFCSYFLSNTRHIRILWITEGKSNARISMCDTGNAIKSHTRWITKVAKHASIGRVHLLDSFVLTPSTSTAHTGPPRQQWGNEEIMQLNEMPFHSFFSLWHFYCLHCRTGHEMMCLYSSFIPICCQKENWDKTSVCVEWKTKSAESNGVRIETGCKWLGERRMLKNVWQQFPAYFSVKIKQIKRN